MASIRYEYNTLEFERNFDVPLTQPEYDLAKKDFYNFYHDHIDAAEQKFNQLKNPHAFKWMRLWILLGIGVVFLGVDYGLKALDYYDAGEVFAMLSFIPFFMIFIQPFQWLLSSSKSSKFSTYEDHARLYFLFQYSKMKNAVSYHDYQIRLAEADWKEFMRFDWEDEAEAITSESVRER